MSMVKQYGIIGIGSNVQFGKKGGHIEYTSTDSGPTFKFKQTDDSTLIRIQGNSPIEISDLTNKEYVDGLIDALDKKFDGQLQGLHLKKAVNAASTENVPLTGTIPLVIDGVTLKDKDRVLLKDQTNAKDNGIYDYNVTDTTYSFVRSSDANNIKGVGESQLADESSEVSGGMFTFVIDGTKNIATGWVLTSPTGNAHLGVDDLIFSQFSKADTYLAGRGLTKDDATFNLNPNNLTIFVDENNYVGVKSNNKSGNILISSGDNGSAVWASLDLGNANTVGSSILQSKNGGTGFSTYDAGDLLIGSSDSKLQILQKGEANQVLVSTNDGVAWSTLYNSSLRDETTGKYIVKGTNVQDSVSYALVSNAATGNAVSIGTDGTDENINLVISPKGTGLLLAKDGYTFDVNSPDNAFVTKLYVDSKMDVSSSLSKINNADNSVTFNTAAVGYEGRGIVTSNNQVVTEFSGNDAAANGERLRITNANAEVQLYALNNVMAGQDNYNVNMRLLPQGDGHVFVGAVGDGVIQAEDDYSLFIRGGKGLTENGGNITIEGGAGTSGNLDGGDITLVPGKASGIGLNGEIILSDDETNPIGIFNKGMANSQNYFEFTNSGVTADPITSSLKIKASGVSTDISLMLSPKGNGLIRVNDVDKYTDQLALTGNQDALVTKKYVQERFVISNKIAGVGLNEREGGYFDVNINANTIYVDGSNNVIVKSNETTGHVLKSTGTKNSEAVWGTLNLENTNTFGGVLPSSLGGTGNSSYEKNDILVGNVDGNLTKLAKGLNNQVLGISNTGNLSYNFVNTLYDTNGKVGLTVSGTNNAVNYFYLKNSIGTDGVEIGSDGTGLDVPILFSPKGNGLLIAKSGYTSKILPTSNDETLITKKYLESQMTSLASSGVRKALITNGSNTFNIGLPLPTVSGKSITITRIILKIATAYVDATYARIYTENSEFMSIDESDISVEETFVAYTDMSKNSSGMQLKISFYGADGETLSVPSSGELTAIVEYIVT